MINNNNKKGIALVTGLLFAVFIIVLGLFFLTYINRDALFASQQQANMTAYLTANAGLEYYRVTGKPDGHTGSNLTITFYLPEEDIPSQQKVILIRDINSNDVTITGEVLTVLGTVRAKRAIVVPGGIYDNWYEK